MDLKLWAITVAMGVAALAWLTLGLRSSTRAERLPAAALRLHLLMFLSWKALGSQVTSPIRACLFVFVSLLLFIHIWGERELRVLRVWPLYAYALILVVSGVFSADQTTAVTSAFRYALLLGSMSVAMASLPQRVIRRIAMEFAIGITVALSVQLLVAPSETTSPIRSLAFDWMLDGWIGLDVSPRVGLVGFSLIMYGLVSREAARLARGASVLTGFLLVVGSQKRTALLITLVAGIAYVAQAYKRRGFLTVVVIVTLVVAGLAVQGPVRDFLDREAAHPESQDATTYRRAIFEASFDRFSERPLLGGGMDVGDTDLLIDVGEEGRVWRSHSEFGNAAAISGVLGLVALTWQYGLSAITVWRNRVADVVPFIVLAGVISTLPFWRVLSNLSFLSLAMVLFVLPAHGVRTFELVGWRTGSSSTEKAPG